MPSDRVERSSMSPHERAWVEGRMKWLVDQFGLDRAQRDVVEPTPEFFPDEYDQSRAAVRRLLDRVCGYVDVDPAVIGLDLDNDVEPAEQSGADLRILVESANLADPELLVALMARDLGIEILVERKGVSEDEADLWPLVELLTIYLGLGIFSGNSIIREHYWLQAASGVGGWSMQRRGFLTLPMLGYALALDSALRGEPVAYWASKLRPDVRAAFDEGREDLARDAALGRGLLEDAALAPWPASIDVEKTHESDDDFHVAPDDVEPPDESADATGCTYCGAPLEETAAVAERRLPPAPNVCGECQRSIAEADRERTLAALAEEDGANDYSAFYLAVGGLGFVILAALAMIALG